MLVQFLARPVFCRDVNAWSWQHVCILNVGMVWGRMHLEFLEAHVMHPLAAIGVFAVTLCIGALHANCATLVVIRNYSTLRIHSQAVSQW